MEINVKKNFKTNPILQKSYVAAYMEHSSTQEGIQC